MSKRLCEPIGDVTWHTPPRNQGQMVCTSYGIDSTGDCWERTDDFNARSVTFRRLGHQTDEHCTPWEPWNEVPECAR